MKTNSISVLVIDSDPASRKYLAAMLGKNGYMVLEASLGREGLISSWRDRPDIIILDPQLPDLTGLDVVTRLRQDPRTAKVHLVAFSNQNKPDEMARLLVAGCNEYLVKSGQTLQKLLDLIPALLEPQSPVKKGSLVVFLSAKGGTGTSSLCANVAMCVANRAGDRNVAMIDLVLPIGSIAQIVGYEGSLNLVTVAEKGPTPIASSYLKDNLVHIPVWNFHLLAGAPDPESASRLSGERVAEILNALMESYDYIFVDLGRSLSRISLPIIQKAEIISMIVSTDLATTALSRTVWQYLQTQSVDPSRLFVIQNRAVGLEGLKKTEIEKMLGLPIQVTMPYMADGFSVANNRHEPLAFKYPTDSATLLLEHVSEQMIELGRRASS